MAVLAMAYQLEVALVLGEVALEDLEDERLDGHRVVDRDVPDALALVPARLAAPRLRLVHDVVGHEQPRLQPLDAPGEGEG